MAAHEVDSPAAPDQHLEATGTRTRRRAARVTSDDLMAWMCAFAVIVLLAFSVATHV
jgi:hypothetical protein